MPVGAPSYRSKHRQSRKEYRREYDRRRGSARARGYDHNWDKASLAFKQANPLCIGCKAVGLIKPAKITDHIIPHKGDAKLFWDENNWQSCCQWHHDSVKARLENRYECAEIAADALRLDSPEAVTLTRELLNQ